MLAEQFGYEVGILVLNRADQNPFYNFSKEIKFYSIDVGGNPLAYIKTYKSGIQKVVDGFQPDVISVCDDGLKGFFIPKFLKTTAKLVYERHASKLIEAKKKGDFGKKIIIRSKWFLMERLASSFKYFVVLTDGNKNEWPRLKNLKVVPNPISFRSEESSTLENKIVICVAKIMYQKGQDLLIKVWEKVHSKFPDWELHLYGKERPEFMDIRNLNNNIYWFPPEKNIQQKYLESSIYALSSRSEGFGMVLIEAMECGLPCVSFDCNWGPSDIIKEGEDGFLVEKENTDQFAEKLMQLMADSDLRKEMGKKAKENVKRYSAEKIVEIWDKLFRDLKTEN